MAGPSDRSRPLDLALIGLAFASILVFTLHVGGGLDADGRLALAWVDLGLVAAYFAIFVASGLMDPQPLRWFRRHAWLAIGLMPLTLPILLSQPWFLLVQVLVLLLRCAKAIDRALHLHVVSGLSERYKARVVEELTQPLLLELARQLEDAVTSRDYAAAVGERLRERRDLVEAAVQRGLEASRGLSRFAHLAPVRRFVEETTQQVVEAAHATLTGPELNTLVREGFHEAFAELRRGIEEPKWPHRGIGIGEAVHLVATEAERRVLPRHEPAPTPG